MAGILNNKERFIDFIITDEGKRQATSGQMKIEFASFTDLHTFYTPSSSFGSGDRIARPGVAQDASSRIFFEATNRFQDVIVPELDAGDSPDRGAPAFGAMRPFRVSDFNFGGNTVTSGTSLAGYAQSANIKTGSALTDAAERMLNGITNNFRDLRILGTYDEFSDTFGFGVSPTTGSFMISSNTAYGRSGPSGDVRLSSIPSLFQDRRFAHLPNFKFLPPQNVPGSVIPGLGKYPKLSETQILTLQDLEQNLADKPYTQVYFSDTSRENNLIGQVFEFSNNGVEKLSIIDFGEFGADEPFTVAKRIFFIGKLRRDSNGADTFLNIFTVVFDN